MFTTVKAEMGRRNINIGKLAELTGIPRQRLAAKIDGSRKLLFSEAVTIKSALGVDMPLEELFKGDE